MLLGKYTLLRKIAAGGMAEIWLARQQGVQGFEKLVVIKRILNHLASDEKFVRMFLDEARLAARLSHPNIVQIYELGVVEGVYYIAMEHVHGEDIRRVVRRNRASKGTGLPIPIATKIVSQACEALHYAHTMCEYDGTPLNVVHRDVSTHNLLLSYQGQVKVVDFGIAKAATQDGETQTGVVKGKYLYMSPEQCRAQRLDSRSDQFALGAVLWELLTGKRLFDRPNDLLIMSAICEDPVLSPRVLNPDVPPDLEHVVLRSLSKNADDRFPDCHAMHVELERLLQRMGTLVTHAELSAFIQELFADRLERWKEIVTHAHRSERSDSALLKGASDLFGSASNKTASEWRSSAASSAPDGELGSVVLFDAPRSGDAEAVELSALDLPGASETLPEDSVPSSPSAPKSRFFHEESARASAIASGTGSSRSAGSSSFRAGQASLDDQEEIDIAIEARTVLEPSSVASGVGLAFRSRWPRLVVVATALMAAVGVAVLVFGPFLVKEAPSTGAVEERVLHEQDAVDVTSTTETLVDPSVSRAPDALVQAAEELDREVAIEELVEADEIPSLDEMGDGKRSAPAATRAPRPRRRSPRRPAREESPRVAKVDARAPASADEERIQQPIERPEYGTLSLNARPWCRARVEGHGDLGTTPLARVRVPAGRQRLICSHPELGQQAVDIVVPVDREVRQTLSFFGELRFRVRPWALVTLNGEELGVTPLPPRSLAVGTYTVVLENQDLGRKETKRFVIRPGETFTLAVDLFEGP